MDRKLTAKEKAAMLKALRSERELLRHRIEMHRSQRRRGLQGAAAEVHAMELELGHLCSAIRKIWTSEEI